MTASSGCRQPRGLAEGEEDAGTHLGSADDPGQDFLVGLEGQGLGGAAQEG